MTLHARLSPSGAERWSACPASPAMCGSLSHMAAAYSDQGTAAHELGARCLGLHSSGKYAGADQFIGEVLRVVNGVYCAPGVTARRLRGREHLPNILHEYVVDAAMAEAVDAYVEGVLQIAQGQPYAVEIRVPIAHITGEPGAGGTADCIVLGDELQVHDLKYGRKRVEAENNTQLMMYASGAIEHFSFALDDCAPIRLVIHQPNLRAVSEWVTTAKKVKVATKKMSVPAKKASKAIKLAVHSPELDALQNPGPHCHFCAAKPICTRNIERIFGAIFDTDFKVEDLPWTTHRDINMAIDQLNGESVDRLSALYPLVEAIKKFAEAVELRIEEELLRGTKIPGAKLVLGREGNRKWSGKETEVAALLARYMAQEEIYKRQLISPAELEKIAKRAKNVEALSAAQDLITRSPARPTLAPEHDPREEYTPENMFEPLSNEDL